MFLSPAHLHCRDFTEYLKICFFTEMKRQIVPVVYAILLDLTEVAVGRGEGEKRPLQGGLKGRKLEGPGHLETLTCRGLSPTLCCSSLPQLITQDFLCHPLGDSMSESSPEQSCESGCAGCRIDNYLVRAEECVLTFCRGISSKMKHVLLGSYIPKKCYQVLNCSSSFWS